MSMWMHVLLVILVVKMDGAQQDVCEQLAGNGRGLQTESDERRHLAVHHFHNKDNEVSHASMPRKLGGSRARSFVECPG